MVSSFQTVLVVGMMEVASDTASGPHCPSRLQCSVGYFQWQVVLSSGFGGAEQRRLWFLRLTQLDVGKPV